MSKRHIQSENHSKASEKPVIVKPDYGAEAQGLNNVLREKSPHIYNALNECGKRMFFPNIGILSQAADAARCKINATIGIATSKGRPILFKSLEDALAKAGLPIEAAIYGSSAGDKELIEMFKGQMGIDGAEPVITNGMTQALSIVGHLFADKDTALVSSGWFWENIDLTYRTLFGCDFHMYHFFRDGKFNVEGLKTTIKDAYDRGKKKQICYLNFPNNPTGYALVKDEADDLKVGLTEVLEEMEDLTLITLIDEAYFGFNYDEQIPKKPLSAQLANLHERCLVIGAKGPTKEINVWGLRTGAIWPLSHGIDPDVQAALKEKIVGIIRSTITMPSIMSQYSIKMMYKDPNFLSEKERIYNILAERAAKIREVSGELNLPCLPWNAGYFFSVKTDNGKSEKVRQDLLSKGLGTIALKEFNGHVKEDADEVLRIAFSCLDTENIEKVLQMVDSSLK